MEASSPLAAMQPYPVLLGHHHFSANSHNPFSKTTRTFEPNAFNFRDLSMKKPPSDYFSLNPMRGSSPTTSLAADLSQNCHIDQSPQLPTPRRALFCSKIAHGGVSRHVLSTPPPPSSSPGPTSDSMDMSPLPHKPAFSAAMEIQLQSPTPEATPADELMMTDSSPSLAPALEQPQPSFPQERKKPNLARPSLRPKGLSTTSIPLKRSTESQAPSVQFVSGPAKADSTGPLSLEEIFVESPCQEQGSTRNTVLAPMGPPRRRPSLSMLNGSGRGNASPGHVRKSSNPLQRPRKQFRRSLSMFEHPGDMMKQEKASHSSSCLPSITDSEGQAPRLPHFFSEDPSDNLPRISQDTLINVLNGKHNGDYDKLVIVDCRFEYEFNGGHITGAVNFNDQIKLANQLFEIEPTARALLVFHCEYSAHRAPIMAKSVRQKDRTVNADQYPNLTYPELYILDGGYSAFFNEHRERCFPQDYVGMNAKEHADACEKGLGKVKQRSKLIRAQTFAFGEHSSQMDDSPTAPSRTQRTESAMDLDMDFAPHQQLSVTSFPQLLDTSRIPARRMFSH